MAKVRFCDICHLIAAKSFFRYANCTHVICEECFIMRSDKLNDATCILCKDNMDSINYSSIKPPSKSFQQLYEEEGDVALRQQMLEEQAKQLDRQRKEKEGYKGFLSDPLNVSSMMLDERNKQMQGNAILSTVATNIPSYFVSYTEMQKFKQRQDKKQVKKEEDGNEQALDKKRRRKFIIE